ncbi:methyltransferase family protein [Candidatus Mycolicibacterium alkanivorans]|uniref:Uncharacterized protein n=1 Tax=Candidatus Mycolicibacterium alkanivorans TaxID=2954114 RepID=A0ABS9YS54_9MYCO|nr:hypothetical protein [Candidatus Mycolicibacterium alkanivorans]MCI4674070.1 hypothetical protein [Candidatus Mycolicibacterium alkanivorans]
MAWGESTGAAHFALPFGDDERVVGFGVMGLPFASGHYLAYRDFPATSFSPGYRSVWHRHPDGVWTFYATTPGPLSCARYFSSATPAEPVQCDIEASWPRAWSLAVSIAGVLGQWRTIPFVIWDLTYPPARLAVWTLFWLGWAIVLAATFMIRVVRHPLMLGFLIAFWSAPTMTVGHLLFASATTGYILIALQLEERDLLATLGARYAAYRQMVPMLMPLPRIRRPASTRLTAPDRLP